MNLGPTQRYLEHLATLGLDVTAVHCDSHGTVRDTSSSTSGTQPAVKLPVLRTEDTTDEAADVRFSTLLGEGGMGRVHAAEQVALRRSVAVKTARVEVAGAMPVELLREALVAGRLEHPNIVPVYMLGRTPDGAALFVMRRVNGVPWTRVLRAPDEPACRALLEGTSDPLEFHLEVFLKVCDAVQFAHEHGVLHRDLKPDNVMVGPCGQVYVVDWGIAVALGEDVLLPLARDAHGVAGTPAYMAPEMAGARADLLGPRTDVYLLGATLYEVLTGGPPHRGSTLPELLAHAFESPEPDFPSETPEEAIAICRRAMAVEPEQRFAEVEELRRAVLALRRHRSAHRIVREAEERSRTLRAELAAHGSSSEPVEEARLQESFAECRFAFRQALAEWSNNTAALRGLQLLLEAMVEHELMRRAPRAALVLLAQLPEPRPVLAARIQAAQYAVEAREARTRELEALQHDADVDDGAALRARAMLALAIVWSAAAFVVGALERSGRVLFGYRESLAILSAYGVTVVSVAVFMRRRTRLNEAQRRLVRGALWTTVFMPLHFVLCWLGGLPLTSALAGLFLMLGAVWVVSSALFDRRLRAGGITLSVGGFALALLPSRWRMDVFGATEFVTLILLWRAWRRT